MYRKILLSFILLLSVGYVTPAFSQRREGGHNFERIHSIKVGYITDRIHLTSDQSAQFWPIYDQYEQEMRAIRMEFRKKYREGAEGDEQSRQFIEDDLDLQDQVLTLKRKYKDQFLKVISAQQLADLYIAERDFKKLLLQQLRKRGRR